MNPYWQAVCRGVTRGLENAPRDFFAPLVTIGRWLERAADRLYRRRP